MGARTLDELAADLRAAATAFRAASDRISDARTEWEAAEREVEDARAALGKAREVLLQAAGDSRYFIVP